MNKLLAITIPLFSLVMSAQAAPSEFNFDGLRNKAIAESCYHEPCTAVRFMDYQVLDSGDDFSVIKAKVVWGGRDWDKKHITWNHHFSSMLITCSKRQPTVQIGGDIISLSISPEFGTSGVEYPYAVAYFTACHNANNPDIGKQASKFRYDTRM